MTNPVAVVNGLLDQLRVAIGRRDGAAAVTILNRIAVVAGPAVARDLQSRLILAGLRRLAGRTG